MTRFHALTAQDGAGTIAIFVVFKLTGQAEAAARFDHFAAQCAGGVIVIKTGRAGQRTFTGSVGNLHVEWLADQPGRRIVAVDTTGLFSDKIAIFAVDLHHHAQRIAVLIVLRVVGIFGFDVTAINFIVFQHLGMGLHADDIVVNHRHFSIGQTVPEDNHITNKLFYLPHPTAEITVLIVAGDMFSVGSVVMTADFGKPEAAVVFVGLQPGIVVTDAVHTTDAIRG